jgi:hypothetical protein
MTKRFYNKNAREKALLEEAYMNVYSENTEYKKALQNYNNDMHDYMGDGDFNPRGPVHKDDVTDPATGKLIGKKGHPKAPNPADYGVSEGEEDSALESILPSLEFKETTKQSKQYQFTDSSQNMPAMSYTVVKQQQPVVTVTSDGKETENVAEPNDIIMSGPSKEQYVVKPEKFPKLYTGKVGGTVTPEQSPRIVARVDSIDQPITFKAPWGEDMILKRGDYLVKDGDQGYYRIAQKEYDETYNPI